MKIQAHKDKNKKTNQETIEDWRRVIKESKTRKIKKQKHRSILADMELNDDQKFKEMPILSGRKKNQR